jgi:formylglycine-generating enzyme required for sulfatase activity
MKKTLTHLILFLLPVLSFGNGITISNLSTNYNSSTGICKAVFDLNWENSWRTNAINNWDAAWVFFKYKEAGVWKHLNLSGVDITLPNGYTYTVPADNKGIFIYRSAAGTGNASLSACEVGVQPKMGTYDIKAFGIEMVYIPSGAFYVGDGSSSSDHRYRSGGTGNPYYVQSGNGYNISMGNTYSYELHDPWNNGTFSYGYPTGYDAMYCMKYEVTQGAYRDFLNCLSYQQQVNRTIAAPSSSTGTNAFTANTRQTIEIATSGSSPSTPAVYGNDANGNNTYNETDDGEWVPITYVNWQDLCAYLDWCALRPMTELEFEKICRGTNNASPGEYAWGTNTVDTTVFTFSNYNKASEIISNSVSLGSANFDIRNYNTAQGAFIQLGPLRSGVFATASSGRSSSGGSYYGVMEMSGNIYELTVSTANLAGRSYTGITGNGELNLNGEADVDHWPGIGGNSDPDSASGVYNGVGVTQGAGIGSRGGTYYWYRSLMRVSDRSVANLPYIYRINQQGIRGLRGPY